MTAITPKRFTIAEYHRLADLGFFQSAIAWSEFMERLISKSLQ